MRFVACWPVAIGALQHGDAGRHPDARTIERVIALVTVTTLLLVLAVAILTVIRFTRRWRQRWADDPPKPTATSDVWSQHRLPEGTEDAVDEDSDRDDGGGHGDG